MNKFNRNILTLMTGTTLAQAIPIAISPILTRLYTPEDFGVFALFISISSLVSVIATGRYELAIMIPSKQSDAINIVALSIIIAMLISFCSLFIIILLNQEICSLLGNNEIGVWLYLIPIAVFATGVYRSLNYWYNRQEKYKIIATSRVIQSVAASSTNIGLGFGGLGSSGLVIGSVLGQSISTGILARSFLRKEYNRFKELKLLKMIALARRHVDFPKINMFHSFLDVGKGLVFNVFLVKFYDVFILGQFYMVNKILLLPSSLIGSSVSQVLFKDLLEKYNKKQDISKSLLHIMKKLFLFALIPFFIVVFFSKPLFIFVFGENWAIGGELARAFAPFVLFHFVASPMSVVPLIVGKQKEAFYINLVGICIYVASILVGYLIFGTLLESLFFLSILMSIYFIFLYVWIYKISKVYR